MNHEPPHPTITDEFWRMDAHERFMMRSAGIAVPHPADISHSISFIPEEQLYEIKKISGKAAMSAAWAIIDEINMNPKNLSWQEITAIYKQYMGCEPQKDETANPVVKALANFAGYLNGTKAYVRNAFMQICEHI